MKVKELIELLKRQNQEAEVNFCSAIEYFKNSDDLIGSEILSGDICIEKETGKEVFVLSDSFPDTVFDKYNNYIKKPSPTSSHQQ